METCTVKLWAWSGMECTTHVMMVEFTVHRECLSRKTTVEFVCYDGGVYCTQGVFIKEDNTRVCML